MKKSGAEGMVSLSMDTNGYFSFNIHDSSWQMIKMDGESPAKIEYRYKEVIRVPEIQTEEKAVFGHQTENIMEITLVYANLQISYPEICKIDSTTWKQMFVDWANEFESKQAGTDWIQEDYLESIGEFARGKIMDYAGLEV